MRKLSALLLVLALVTLVAAPIFAQEAQQPTLEDLAKKIAVLEQSVWSWTFFDRTRLIGNSASTNITLKQIFYLFDWGFTYTADTFGGEMLLEFYMPNGESIFDSTFAWDAAHVYFYYIDAWAQLFDGMMLYIGQGITDMYSPMPLGCYTTFVQPYSAHGYDYGYGLGFHDGYDGVGGFSGSVFEYSPMAGLKVAMFINAPLAGDLIGNVLNYLEFSAKYKVSGLGTIYAGYSGIMQGFWAAFTLSAVKDLYFQVKYENVTGTGSFITASAGYKLSDIGLGIYDDFYLYMPTTGTMGWDTMAYIKYALPFGSARAYFYMDDTSAMIFMVECRVDTDYGMQRFRFNYNMPTSATYSWYLSWEAAVWF